ncbi:hypothetical protein ACFL59_05340 [Planctomycetota bacterium]
MTKRATRSKKEVVLVFGEDDNDTSAIRELLLALKPDMPTIRKMRTPPVLIKGVQQFKRHKNARAIANVVKAVAAVSNVRHVFAHQDCDAIEPAHVKLSKEIEAELASEGVEAIAVTPAWEIEAWWFLWPDAVVAVCSRWRRPARSGRRVGRIVDAKTTLRRSLRPRSREKPPRAYADSDSPKVAKNVRVLGLIDKLDAISDSFDAFARRARSASY